MKVLRPGDPVRLGAYRLLGRLGEGGQGVVFLAEAPDGVRVAVKSLHPDLVSDAGARSRFLREAGAAKRVARFCTAQVLDASADGESPYIVSEYIEGPSLHELVASGGPRTGAALERLAVGTATALAGIHEAGVVHRDFKPQNVLIGADGPRVIDFGVARSVGSMTMTTASGTMGTPAYMAPEQFTGDEVGPAADVFAWGGTMLYAATGEPAFGRDTLPAVMHRILHGNPDLSPLPSPLRELVAACLAKDPAARPTAQQILLTLLGRQQPPEITEQPPATGKPPATERLPVTEQAPVVVTRADPSPARTADPGPARTEVTQRAGRRSRGWIWPAAAAAVVAAGLAAVPLMSHGAGSPNRQGAAGPPALSRTSAGSGHGSKPQTRKPTHAPTSKPAHKPKPKRKAPAKGGRDCAGRQAVPAGNDHGALTAQYCSVWVPGGGVPVYAAPNAGSAIVGRLDQGGTANWFVGQSAGGRVQVRGWWNTHWAYTLSDGARGRWGWVPIVYFHGGANGAADATLAACANRCHPY